MDTRWLISLLVVGLAFGGFGCTPESRRHRGREISLPGQTGSNIRRHILIDAGLKVENRRHRESKKRESKPVTKERKVTKKERKPAKRPSAEISPPDRLR